QDDSCNVVRRMVRLNANPHYARFPEGVAAATDVTYAAGGIDEVLVAHQFRGRRRDFRSNASLQTPQIRLVPLVAEQPFPQPGDAEPLPLPKSICIERIENQAADVVLPWINQWIFGDLLQRYLRQSQLRGDALALRCRGNSCQLIARLFLVGLG